MSLVVAIYKVCQQGPLSKDWGLRDQIQRSAVSVSANIAEGYEGDSRKEYIHYLKIAKGSVGELRCLLRIATRLHYISEDATQSLIEESLEIARMLRGLARSLEHRILNLQLFSCALLLVPWALYLVP
jgi:four helix bundle protein